MSRLYLLSIISLFILVLTNNVDACSMFPPSIGIEINNNESCDKYMNYLESKNVSIGYDREWMHKYGCKQRPYYLDGGYEDLNFNISEYAEFFSFMGFSGQDESIIKTLFDELKPFSGFSYRYIVKQTNGQYEEFKKEVDEINRDMCDCTKLNFVNRIDDWTAYESTFKATCSFSTACFQPPIYCAFIPKKYGNLFVKAILPLLSIVVIFLLVYFYKKRRLS